MNDVARYPYLTTRKGSSNYYYKRSIPMELRAIAARTIGRTSTAQIWKSLGTSHRREAEQLYAAEHHRVEQTFTSWRRELNGEIVQASPQPDTVPLTTALTRRVVDAWKADLVERDFRRRAELWKAVQADPEALFRGDLVPYEERYPDKSPVALVKRRVFAFSAYAFSLLRDAPQDAAGLHIPLHRRT